MVIMNDAATEQDLLNKELGIEVDAEEKSLSPEQQKDEDDFREFAGIEKDEKFPTKSFEQRFRMIYKKHKDAQRETEQTKAEAAEDKRLMREHLQRVMASTDKLAQTTEKLVDNKETEAIQGEIQTIQNTIKALKADRAEAMELGEWKKAAALEDEIDEQKEALQAKKEEARKKPAKQEERQSVPETVLEEQKAVNKWAKETSWYNPEHDDYDPAMVTAAREMDAAFQGLEKWKGKPAIERVKAVQERIEKKFNFQPVKKKGNGAEDTFDLEGPGESHKKSGDKQSLTADQKRVAHEFYDDLVGPAKAEDEYRKYLA
jgi:hypothetical protein